MPGLLNGWYRKDILIVGVPLIKALIKEIKHKAEELGSELLIGIIPSPIQVYSNTYSLILKKTFPNNAGVQYFLQDTLKPQRVIVEICQDLNLPCLDLYPILYKNHNQELYIPREGHFNKMGHSLVAQDLAKFIIHNVENSL